MSYLKKNFMNGEVNPVRSDVDCGLHEMSERWGQALDEALFESFGVEVDENQSCIEEMYQCWLYDTSSEEEILKRESFDKDVLNDGSASVDDLEELEKEALEYFKRVSVLKCPQSTDERDCATGFVQVYDGVRFTKSGECQSVWRGVGRKFKIATDDILDFKLVENEMEVLGFDWLAPVRVVFYGPSLERFVGSKVYEKEQAKELVEVSGSEGKVFVAIPSYEECKGHDGSIFSRIDSHLKEEVLYGAECSIDRVAMGHWELTCARLDELKHLEVEEQQDRRLLKIQKRFVQKRNEFDSNFKEPRALIKALNSKEIKVSDLKSCGLPVLRKIVYLCEKKGERLEHPSTYYQVKSLVKKLKIEEISSAQSSTGMDIISKVNSGIHVDIHLLDFEELDDVFKILWGDMGVRISSNYKEIYFKLKERYLFLKDVSSKKAA